MIRGLTEGEKKVGLHGGGNREKKGRNNCNSINNWEKKRNIRKQSRLQTSSLKL